MDPLTATLGVQNASVRTQGMRYSTVLLLPTEHRMEYVPTNRYLRTNRTSSSLVQVLCSTCAINSIPNQQNFNHEVVDQEAAKRSEDNH